MDEAVLREIVVPGTTKIVLLVMDGLGGLPHPDTGRSELETAEIPNLDALARQSVCGLTVPVGPGITPGSGPGHLALFGYDPIKYNIGRGVLEAVGIDFDLGPNDVAARGNFCTVGPDDLITNRRAGRIPTDLCIKLCAELAKIEIPGLEIFVEPVREHRFVLVFRGEGLADALHGTDPNREGLAPLPVRAQRPEAEATAQLFNGWIKAARTRLAHRDVANMVLVRGFAKYPDIPSMQSQYQLDPAAIAIYPMYRGLAKLVGMKALPGGTSFQDEIDTMRANWDEHDFFFIHYKPTDAAGEDGDFDRKVQALENIDKLIPQILDLNPDVLMVGGDHSTPSIMAAHSWHPVPFMLRSKLGQADRVQAFSEADCAGGVLGTFPAQHALSIAMAHAGRFTKYGA
ncbi:MAG: 2,3-bisphosphoglycerate-independent phosphoglycerate mutase [Caulobacteraceae bacterium]|nr:2,3-bisphosphoglycerate-independent phosphoglycerate mutase [Caulobacteraceae bacterium]